MRQIVLDTETTGLEVDADHRIIEVGCIELVNRRRTGNNFCRYVNPERAVDHGALAVHGISGEQLAGEQPFRAIAQTLWDYLKGAELLIHNAEFDVGFLDREFARAGIAGRLADICTVVDTLALARKLHPGQKAGLDALCKRYGVDNSSRDLHGARLDAGLLADVYLAMTGGQSRLTLDADAGGLASRFVELLGAGAAPLRVVEASEEELAAHRARLRKLADKGKLIWQAELDPAAPVAAAA